MVNGLLFQSNDSLKRFTIHATVVIHTLMTEAALFR